MNLYVVSPKDTNDMHYDQFLSVTVIAENEVEAKKLARKQQSPIWSFQYAFEELSDEELIVKLISLNNSKIVESSFLYA